MSDIATDRSAAGHNYKPARIELDGEELEPDAEFCKNYLAGCSRRTAARYDKLGLAYVIIRGEKWRPIGRGKEWLAGRIVRRNPPRRGRA